MISHGISIIVFFFIILGASKEFRPVHIFGKLEDRVQEHVIAECHAKREKTLQTLERLESNHGFLVKVEQSN